LVLIEKGRLKLAGDPFEWLQSIFTKIPFHEAPLNHQVAIQSRLIKVAHQDPADRFLVATAQVYQLTLVTADDRLIKGQGYDVLPNR